MSKNKPKPSADWCDVVTCTCGKSGTALSEYTPTKLEVRAQYAKDSTGSDEYIRAISEFDRWLEQHDAEIVAKAEERFIKLLESNATGEYKQVMLTPKLISEIKGEQK